LAPAITDISSRSRAADAPVARGLTGLSFDGHDFGKIAVTPRHDLRGRREYPLPLPVDVREGTLTPDLRSIVGALGPGKPLHTPKDGLLARKAGLALDEVRVHDDHQSHMTAALLNSEAFTVGNDVILGDWARSGMPRPWLLAHEVSHAVQQHPRTIGTPGVDPEREADQFADIVTGKSGNCAPAIPGRAPVGLARKVIWKQMHDLPDDLLLILDLDDGDFVGGCVKAIVPHAGVKLIQKTPHLQLFNLHVGFVTNPLGEACIFFYESVTGVCEQKCFPNSEDLKKAWEEIKQWIEEMLKRVFQALAIMALIIAAVILAALIAEIIVAALLVLA
jgi:hypothetical protein